MMENKSGQLSSLLGEIVNSTDRDNNWPLS